MAWYYILLVVIASILLLFIVIFFVTGHIVSKYIFLRREKYEKESDEVWHLLDEDFYLNCKTKERVEIKSHDNLKLVGYLYRNNSNKYIIFVHGYHGVYYEQSYLASYMYKQGYNCLLVSDRGHGESEGRYVTMGYEDKFDVENWIKYIINQDNNARICLYGWSMGGATILGTSGLNLPNNVKVLVSDCAYSSIIAEITFIAMTKVFKGNKFLSRFASYATYFYAKVFYKIDLIKDSPLKMHNKSTLPTLFIHGNVDNFVSKDFIYKLYNSYKGKKEMKIFNTSKHCASLRDNKEEYLELLSNFINENI